MLHPSTPDRTGLHEPVRIDDSGNGKFTGLSCQTQRRIVVKAQVMSHPVQSSHAVATLKTNNQIRLVWLARAVVINGMNSSFTSTQKTELPVWLQQDMRSNHAGETGAVFIYRGILAVSRDVQVRAFAQTHLETEEKHLALISNELGVSQLSLFLPLWKLAGYLTGAIPSIFGSNAVYATVDAVETFVDQHYLEQIERLQQQNIFPELRRLLERCREEEIIHRDEARNADRSDRGALLLVLVLAHKRWFSRRG